MFYLVDNGETVKVLELFHDMIKTVFKEDITLIVIWSRLEWVKTGWRSR